jgi:hypothetical protein
MGSAYQHIQFVQVTGLKRLLHNRWLAGLGVCLAAAAGLSFYVWGRRVGGPPKPPAARLPADARVLLQPFRKDHLDLKLDGGGEVQYRIAMQEGATLVYSWTASRGPVSCEFADQKPVPASEAHGAFVAQSSGWYRWHWRNQTDHPVSIALKLSGYYEPSVP